MRLSSAVHIQRLKAGVVVTHKYQKIWTPGYPRFQVSPILSFDRLQRVKCPANLMLTFQISRQRCLLTFILTEHLEKRHRLQLRSKSYFHNSFEENPLNCDVSITTPKSAFFSLFFTLPLQNISCTLLSNSRHASYIT